jgi:hypothetical protein
MLFYKTENEMLFDISWIQEYSVNVIWYSETHEIKVFK